MFNGGIYQTELKRAHNRQMAVKYLPYNNDITDCVTMAAVMRCPLRYITDKVNLLVSINLVATQRALC